MSATHTNTTLHVKLYAQSLERATLAYPRGIMGYLQEGEVLRNLCLLVSDGRHVDWIQVDKSARDLHARLNTYMAHAKLPAKREFVSTEESAERLHRSIMLAPKSERDVLLLVLPTMGGDGLWPALGRMT